MREYHHLGLPTKEVREDEISHPELMVSTTPFMATPYRIQWVRYHDGCSLPKLIQEVAHVAFKVDDLDRELEGKKVLVEPYFPLEGFRVAFIEEFGAPIELIETTLDDATVAQLAKESSTI